MTCLLHSFFKIAAKYASLKTQTDPVCQSLFHEKSSNSRLQPKLQWGKALTSNIFALGLPVGHRFFYKWALKVQSIYPIFLRLEQSNPQACANSKRRGWSCQRDLTWYNKIAEGKITLTFQFFPVVSPPKWYRLIGTGEHRKKGKLSHGPGG